MAYEDALFQLGMDLTRSSTAQKEDLAVTDAITAEVDRKDHFIERDGVRFAGTHLIVDLFGAKRLDDVKHVERTLKQCAEVAGATLLQIHLHNVTPNGGVAGVAVLSQSHISIHSWPESHYAALDIFMGGETNPHLAIAVLKDAFQARDVVVKEHLRGEELEQLQWSAAAAKKASARLKKPTRAKQVVAA